MEWLLFAFIPIFVLLAVGIKPLYDKWYEEPERLDVDVDYIGLTHKGTYDPRLDAYLQLIAAEATRPFDSERWPPYAYGTQRHQLDRPDRWEKELLSRRERTCRAVSDVTFIVCVVVIVYALWNAVSYDFNPVDLRGWARCLSVLSIVAVTAMPTHSSKLLNNNISNIQTPNQPMKPTPPLRNKFSPFATTPVRGLSACR